MIKILYAQIFYLMVNWLVFGLGNPGTKYCWTRHNVGKDILSHIDRSSKKWKKNSYENCVYQMYEIVAGLITHKVIVAKSEIFMNLSGMALKNIAEQFGVETQNIIVVYDDYSLLFGGIKLSQNTSHGGHNGIKSIIENIIDTCPEDSPHANEKFIRLRIGIKNRISDDEKVDLGDYVLEKFSAVERETIDKISQILTSIIEDLVTKGLSFAQNKFNKLIY